MMTAMYSIRSDMPRYIFQSPFIVLNFASEPVFGVDVLDSGPEKAESTAYSRRMPRNGNAKEIAKRSCR